MEVARGAREQHGLVLRCHGWGHRVEHHGELWRIQWRSQQMASVERFGLQQSGQAAALMNRGQGHHLRLSRRAKQLAYSLGIFIGDHIERDDRDVEALSAVHQGQEFFYVSGRQEATIVSEDLRNRVSVHGAVAEKQHGWNSIAHGGRYL